MISSTYEGLKVLDLSTYIAGPLCATTLGDLGADVIKIERPPVGDETRALPPFHDGISTMFQAVNRNKRSLAMDFRRGAGRDALLKLVETADVVVASFGPGLAEKLQLTWDDLHAVNDQLILCSVSAFGDGELGSKMPGYDGLVQSVSGLLSFTGHEGAPHLRLAPSVLDVSTGMWGAIGVMAALTRRAAGGGGEHVRPALLDTAVQVMNHQVLASMATGEPPARWGSGSPSAVPFRIFECSDGAFMLATASDKQFERLCAELDLPELASKFAGMDARVEHRAEVDDALQAVFSASGTVAEWVERLSAAGISVGRVNDVREGLDLPVTKERGLFVDPAPLGRPDGLPILRAPFDSEGEGVRLAPPRMGEHSEEVLAEAGYSDAEIKQLLAG